MKLFSSNNKKKLMQRGFAMPAIVLIATTTLIVATTAIQSAFAYRSLLDVQYYYGLAREAAQAGLVYAAACYKVNGSSVTSISPITPNESCAGAASGSQYVFQNGNVRTTFSVTVTITTGASGEVMRAVSTGTANLVTSGGTVVRTYQQNLVRSTAGAESELLGIASDGGTVLTLTSLSQAYGSGENSLGQLGIGNLNDQTTPQQYQLPTGVKSVQVYKEDNTTLVLGSDGQLYGSGENSFGQLGTGSTNASLSTPTRFALTTGLTVADVQLNGNNTWVIASDGFVYGAGQNNKGQLGDGTNTQRTSPVKFNITLAPTASAVKLAGDNNMLMVLASNGNVYTAGDNANGQLGNLTTNAGVTSTPVRFSLPVGVTAVDVGVNNREGCVLGSNGIIYCAGQNANGRHGKGDTSASVNPIATFNIPGGLAATHMTNEDSGICAIASNGRVYCAGRNNQGQLGNNSTSSQSTPVEFQMPTGLTALSMTQEDDNMFVLASDGNVYGAGDNAYGQLGDGSTTDRRIPVRFGLPTGVLAKAVLSDGEDTFVLGSDGNLYAAGRNLNGYFGSAGPKSTPVVFPLSAGVKAYLPVSPVILF